MRAGRWGHPVSPCRLADVRLDVAVPHATGRAPALEVEDCACPPGYRGPSCQVSPPLSPWLWGCSRWLTPVPVPTGLRRGLHPQHQRALPGHL